MRRKDNCYLEAELEVGFQMLAERCEGGLGMGFRGGLGFRV